MEYDRIKPKLVFFQFKYDGSLPEFLLMHKRDHVRCLAEFFDVTTIDYDCDYGQICDQYQPDLTLFESAFNVSFSYCKRPRIVNIGACPNVPKLGFLHSDSFSQGRAGFFSDMDHWGIETFFTICTTAAEHVPEISDKLFIWPNFIDGEVYRDYGQWKNIPILFTGNQNALYPWRRKIIELVSKHYPALICPHPGFAPVRGVVKVMAGEPYARMLNASWFVPACGTVAREAVRKHFEVPGAKACLITEKSSALEAAGFVDMKNCVFADESNILDKLQFLFGNPAVLDDIIVAGHQLVHARHTLKHRDQIFQWFNLQRSLKSNEKIVQTNPFGALRIVEKSLGARNSHIISNGFDLELLHQGDEKLWKGDYADAESLYLRCLNYVPWMPEPQLRLTLCNLYKGNPKEALSWVLKPIEFTLVDYKAVDPDPVEWAYFIITLLCLGKVGSAAKRARQFSWVNHPELDRVRWVTNALAGREDAATSLADRGSRYRISIHRSRYLDVGEWARHLCVMLKACGQGELAERVMACVVRRPLLVQSIQGGKDVSSEMTRNYENGKQPPRRRHIVTEESREAGYFKRQLCYRKLRFKTKLVIKYVLHWLERKWGNFLPYRLSRRKNDEFFHTIEELVEKEDIRAILIIGAALREDTTRAVLAGAQKNSNKPSVMCLSASRQRSMQTSFSRQFVVKWYSLLSSSPEDVSKEAEDTVKQIKEENQMRFFDILVIDGSELPHWLAVTSDIKRELYASRYVILDDVNKVYNHETYDALLGNPEYILRDQNLDLRNGHAVFEKQRDIGLVRKDNPEPELLEYER
jgi:hypothetical protein